MSVSVDLRPAGAESLSAAALLDFVRNPQVYADKMAAFEAARGRAAAAAARLEEIVGRERAVVAREAAIEAREQRASAAEAKAQKVLAILNGFIADMPEVPQS